MKTGQVRHILVVASTFPSTDEDPVPAFVKDQVTALKKAHPELEFAVLAPHDNRLSTKSFQKHETYDEYRFHYFWPRRFERLSGRGIMPALQSNRLNYLLVPFFLISGYLSAKKLVKNLSPDLVYAHWFMPSAVMSARVAKKAGVPFVFTSHSSDLTVMSKIPFGKNITRAVMDITSYWTVVSERTMQKAKAIFSNKEWRLYSKKMRIIPMGVNTARMTARKAKTKSQTSRKANHVRQVLFIGRLAEVKGVDLLIKAFASSSIPNTELVIAGSGPEAKKLISQAKTLGVDSRVHFQGYVSGKAKENLMREADVLVVPSRIDRFGHTEGFPVVLMEGMSFGKIIIASDVSGGELVIKDGVSGFIFTNDNEESLVNKIRMALELDFESKQHMSNLIQGLSKQYEWPVVSKNYYEFLIYNPIYKT